LHAAISWSWELLPEPDRQALSDLALFCGAFSLEDAEDILGSACLESLTALVERSLVQRSLGGYRLLKAIREFAGEQRKPQSAAQKAYAAWVLSQTEALLPLVGTADAREAIAQLGRLEADCISALPLLDSFQSRLIVGEALQELYITTGASESRLKLANCLIGEASGGSELGQALLMKGIARSGIDIQPLMEELEQCFSLLEGLPEKQAKAFYWQATCLHRGGRYEESQKYARQALEKARMHGTVWAEALSLLRAMEHLTAFPGSTEEQRVADCERALAQMQKQGQLLAAVHVLMRLVTILHNIGEQAKCRRYREQLVEVVEQLPNARLLGLAYHHFALSLSQDGEYDRAIELNERCWKLIAQTSNEHNWRWILQYNAMVFCNANRLSEAEALFEQVRIWALGRDRYHDLAHSCEGLAVVAMLKGQPAAALQLARQGPGYSEHVSDHILADDIHLQAGLALHWLGRLKEAEAEYQQVGMEELHGEQRAIFLGRKWLLAREQQKLEEAARYQSWLKEMLEGRSFSGSEGLKCWMMGLEQEKPDFSAILQNVATSPAWVRQLALAAHYRNAATGL
jgi:tetratricopeptide (TPR) repeat protein